MFYYLLKFCCFIVLDLGMVLILVCFNVLLLGVYFDADQSRL